jgi:hypothetical protein
MSKPQTPNRIGPSPTPISCIVILGWKRHQQQRCYNCNNNLYIPSTNLHLDLDKRLIFLAIVPIDRGSSESDSAIAAHPYLDE